MKAVDARVRRRSFSTLTPERLESRRLFASGATVSGYTPAQIKHAYGFDQISFGAGAGAPAADGSGQTIAIVDAYNDPNIASDLSTFDSQFGLPSADLSIVNEHGGKTLPTTDAGWAGEIALDVEWAHAIAPGAKILLVEANSSSLDDLMAGVDLARHAAGVSVVSMSWGGSEFFSWTGGESASETNLDPTFTTPSGHQGVTFFASAGDTGAQSGVTWPSISPNVVSVGGTSLYLSDSNGTYSQELGWAGTNGGFSQVESEPTYQQSVQTSGVRTSPDVAYNADPSTGFAVYDSLAYQGASGWQVVGGTSAGSPQWAALVAIANQGRVLEGMSTLDGASQTLSALYGAYTLAAYSTTYNDVVAGGAGQYRWRWGGFGQSGYDAQSGYDLVTGLGTPKAAGVVAALLGTDQTATPTPTPTPTALPPSPIQVTDVSSPSVSAIDGQHGTARVTVTNTSEGSYDGPLTITLMASQDASGGSTGDATLATVTLNRVRLAAGKSHTFKVAYTYPTNLPAGSYQIIGSAQVDGTAQSEAVAPSAVALSPATVDLAAAFSTAGPINLTAGKQQSAILTLTNEGNVTASGTVNLSLLAGNNVMVDSSDVLLGSVVGRKIQLKPGASVRVRVHFATPTDVQPGTYELIAAVTSSTTPANTDASDDRTAVATI